MDEGQTVQGYKDKQRSKETQTIRDGATRTMTINRLHHLSFSSNKTSL